jgi:hypothetical protein
MRPPNPRPKWGNLGQAFRHLNLQSLQGDRSSCSRLSPIFSGSSFELETIDRSECPQCLFHDALDFDLEILEEKAAGILKNAVSGMAREAEQANEFRKGNQVFGYGPIQRAKESVSRAFANAGSSRLVVSHKVGPEFL